MDYAVLMNQRQPIPSNTSSSRVQDSSVQTIAWDYHEQLYSPEPRVPLPERFSGNRKKFRTFQN
ncbi:hypothetical protein, partial [Klebsiella pneumoniae]|uniref:hypothetical protein n=1 Tax=Klebsiella pneumoniae TaxID=573 RepID=UPI001D0E59EC